MILKRKDGTFVIDGPVGPYHVTKEDPRFDVVRALVATGAMAVEVTEDTETEVTESETASADPVWNEVVGAVADLEEQKETPTAMEVLRLRFEDSPLSVEREWRDSISTERLRRLKAGFTHADGNTYPIDPEAQTIFTAMFTLALASAPVEYMARTSDNRNVEMSAVEFTTFAFAAFAAGNAISRKAFEAKDLIAASKDFYTKYEVYLRYME